MKSVIAAFACIAFWSTLAAASEEDASLKDTLSWLRTAIDAHANNGTPAAGPCDSNRQNKPCWYHYQSLDFSGCSISYEFDGHVNAGGEQRSRKATIVVPLGELALPQASRVRDDIKSWQVPLSVRENARGPIHIDEDTDPTYQSGSRSYDERLVWLEFGDLNADNQAIALKVAKALTRAIELCDPNKDKPAG
jgi:hypothetical protein